MVDVVLLHHQRPIGAEERLRWTVAQNYVSQLMGKATILTSGRMARIQDDDPSLTNDFRTGTTTSACFSTPIICSTLNRFFRIQIPPPSQAKF